MTTFNQAPLEARLPVASNDTIGFIPEADPNYIWPESYKAVLDYCYRQRRFLNIVGPPGCGKTSAIKQLCAIKKKRLVKISLNGDVDVPDIIGQQCISRDGQFYWRDGQLTTALKQGDCLILLDEINFMRPEISAALHSLLDDTDLVLKNIQQNTDIPLRQDTVIFATMNPSGGEYAGTNPLNSALLDRFHQVYLLDYLSPEKEMELLIRKNGVMKEEAKFIVRFAKGIRHSYHNKHGMKRLISTRWLLAYAEAVASGLDPRTAFVVSILNKFDPQEVKEVELLYKQLRGS